jgi:hypothetical protein
MHIQNIERTTSKRNQSTDERMLLSHRTVIAAAFCHCTPAAPDATTRVPASDYSILRSGFNAFFVKANTVRHEFDIYRLLKFRTKIALKAARLAWFDIHCF